MRKITGKQMRKLREATGLTQSQLAEILGYRREEIVRFETEVRPIPRSLQIILSFVSLEQLASSTLKGE